MINDFLQSFFLVFSSEMGDKTQLLALVLAMRFKKVFPIMAGIFTATVLNHGLATILGSWVAQHVDAKILKWILAGIFGIFAIWILVPDKMEDEDHNKVSRSEQGAFLTTTILFFLAEMGDKTQLATVALGAKIQAPILVTVGTTAGMLAADGLAVVFGESLTKIVPLKTIRWCAAGLFVLFGIGLLLFDF